MFKQATRMVFQWQFNNRQSGIKQHSKIFCRIKHLLIWPLTHFMTLISFDTSWKHQKTRGFLMFSGVSKEICGMKWVKNVMRFFEKCFRFSLTFLISFNQNKYRTWILAFKYLPKQGILKYANIQRYGRHRFELFNKSLSVAVCNFPC